MAWGRGPAPIPPRSAACASRTETDRSTRRRLLLATTAGGATVTGGPVVAFDGTVWLVAWSEEGVGGNDLRAVAVATDGTVVDATPRLLASGLGGSAPAIASAGDGRSLLVDVRPDGGKSAVRAQLVPGT